MFDRGAEEQIMGLFRKNVANCNGFAHECNQIFSLDVNFIDPATCSQTDLLNLMTAAIGKWLSVLVQAQSPHRVELASVHGYRIDPSASNEDLVSFALRFTPVIKPSPDALSPTPPAPVDECETAKAIVRRSAKRKDVDSILDDNQELREELIVEAEDLLAEARYDITGYRTWIEE